MQSGGRTCVTLSSKVLGFMNPACHLRRWEVMSFCMQLENWLESHYLSSRFSNCIQKSVTSVHRIQKTQNYTTTSNEARYSILDVDDVQTSSNIYDDDDDGQSWSIITPYLVLLPFVQMVGKMAFLNYGGGEGGIKFGPKWCYVIYEHTWLVWIHREWRQASLICHLVPSVTFFRFTSNHRYLHSHFYYWHWLPAR